MLEEIIDSAALKIDTGQVGKDFPHVIHFGNTAQVLREVSGKRVASATIDLFNVVYFTLLQEVAARTVHRNNKQISPQDVIEIMKLMGPINLNLGSLTITRVNERADVKLVRSMVSRELRKIREAMKDANVSDDSIELAMKKYEVMSGVEDEEEDNIPTDEVEDETF